MGNAAGFEFSICGVDGTCHTTGRSAFGGNPNLPPKLFCGPGGNRTPYSSMPWRCVTGIPQAQIFGRLP